MTTWRARQTQVWISVMSNPLILLTSSVPVTTSLVLVEKLLSSLRKNAKMWSVMPSYLPTVSRCSSRKSSRLARRLKKQESVLAKL